MNAKIRARAAFTILVRFTAKSLTIKSLELRARRIFIDEVIQIWRCGVSLARKERRIQSNAMIVWRKFSFRMQRMRRRLRHRFFAEWKKLYELQVRYWFLLLKKFFDGWRGFSAFHFLSLRLIKDLFRGWRNELHASDRRLEIADDHRVFYFFRKFKEAVKKSSEAAAAGDDLCVERNRRLAHARFQFWLAEANAACHGRVLTRIVRLKISREFFTKWQMREAMIRKHRWRIIGHAFNAWREIAEGFTFLCSDLAKIRTLKMLSLRARQKRTFREKLLAIRSRLMDEYERDLLTKALSGWYCEQQVTAERESILHQKVEDMRAWGKTEKFRWMRRTDPGSTLEVLEAFTAWRSSFKIKLKLKKISKRLQYAVEGRLVFRVLDNWCMLALPPLRADTLQRRRYVRRLNWPKPVAPALSMPKAPGTPKSEYSSFSAVSGLRRKI